MSGRRFVDIARVAKASRLVGSRHAALRRRHFNLYQKTSSLWKLLGCGKLQSSFSYSTKANNYVLGDAAVTSQSTVGGNRNVQTQATSLDQDHFYERSNDNSTANPLPSSDIHVKQEGAKQPPLPDGTIPPLSRDTGTASESQALDSASLTSTQPSAADITEAERARQAQRQAESPIPSREAEPPQSIQSRVDSLESDGPEIHVEQEQDVFYSPSSDASPVLSSLPRVKVPKSSADIQQGDDHVPDRDIDQDVFYSSKPSSPEHPLPRTQTGSAQGDLSEEMYSELFHSRKVAQMLQRRPTAKSAPRNDLKLQRPKEAALGSTKEPSATDQDFHAERPSSFSAGAKTNKDEELTRLAADLANDAQTQSKEASNSGRRPRE